MSDEQTQILSKSFRVLFSTHPPVRPLSTLFYFLQYACPSLFSFPVLVMRERYYTVTVSICVESIDYKREDDVVFSMNRNEIMCIFIFSVSVCVQIC